MATTARTPIQIEISVIKITEWVDISSKVERAAIPNTMVVSSIIDGIHTDNILLRYIPITCKNEIIEEIKKVLRLEERYQDASY